MYKVLQVYFCQGKWFPRLVAEMYKVLIKAEIIITLNSWESFCLEVLQKIARGWTVFRYLISFMIYRLLVDLDSPLVWLARFIYRTAEKCTTFSQYRSHFLISRQEMINNWWLEVCNSSIHISVHLENFCTLLLCIFVYKYVWNEMYNMNIYQKFHMPTNGINLLPFQVSRKFISLIRPKKVVQLFH